MNRTTICTLILSLTLASAAGAAPTAEENCRAAKLDALRKRTFCIEGERRKEVLGKTPDTAKCDDKFDSAIMMADVAAAKKGASCRWLDNGDGTATDLNYGLQWELKTDDGSVHDKDNKYTWCVQGASDTSCDDAGNAPDGTAFTMFLRSLNAGLSSDGSTTTGCFTGHCDWRIPTIGELRGILDGSVPGCGSGGPCTTIPGSTIPNFYWSSSTYAPIPQGAWNIAFGNDAAYADMKNNYNYVRAVRGGS
jgi:hypothetical protein